MNSLKIKKGDNVQVIAGKDRGRSGKVVATDAKNGTVIVSGVNIATKHKKPRSMQDQGGIIKQELPLEASNVMVVCSKCHKPTRIKTEVSASGEKTRLCKKCGAQL